MPVTDALLFNWQMGLVAAFLIFAMGMFVFEVIATDLVAICLMVGLALTGILNGRETISGLASPALVTIACLFILSEGLIRTGAVGMFGRWISGVAGGGEKRVLLILMVSVALSSAFMNNTPIVVMFLPIVLSLAKQFNISPSRLLMPVSFAAMLGGTCTVIGTSTNVLVSNLIESYSGVLENHNGFGMFEFSVLGLICTVVGIFYLLVIGHRLVPERRTVSTYTGEGRVTEFHTEIRIPKESAWVGQSVADSISEKFPEVTVLEVIRGEEILWPPFGDLVLSGRDILLVKGDVSDVSGFQKSGQLETLPEFQSEDVVQAPKESTLAELVIQPGSSLVGKTLGEVGFLRHHGVVVMAIQRSGHHIRKSLPQQILHVGDTLLVQGSRDAVENLHDEEDFLLIEAVTPHLTGKRKTVAAIAILLGVILSSTVGLYPMVVCAIAGALAMVLVGCLTLRRAYHAIDWSLLVLIAGTISLGLAMEKTGLASWISHRALEVTLPLGKVWVLSGFYLLAVVLTSFISNTAAAVILFPIAVQTAELLGVPARPFLIALTFGASAAFATPIGYQTNLFIYGPGGYRFSDFLRVGLPLNILLWGVVTLVIPMIWPLQ